MKFLYLFDMIEFDDAGNICQTKTQNLEQAQANYLYLLAKYNQAFLKINNLEIPAFFKEELSDLLDEVENKKTNFKDAEKIILKNCLSQFVEERNQSKTEKDFVLKLNELHSRTDTEYANKFDKAINNLQLGYIITAISGKIFEELVKSLNDPKSLADKKSKSNIYKNIIKYNSLTASAEQVKNKDFENKKINKTVLEIV